MKNIAPGFLAAGLLLISGAALADKIATVAYGEFRLGGAAGPGDPAGLLVSCPAGEIVVETRATYTFLDGICDDSGTLPACAGRVTYYAEGCSLTGAASNITGNLSVDLRRGAFRVCFDDLAGGNCRDGSPNVVAEGDLLHHSASRTDGDMAIGNGQLVVTETTPFVIDGEEREHARGVITYDSVGEQDPTGVCFVNPGIVCGISSVGYREEAVQEQRASQRPGVSPR